MNEGKAREISLELFKYIESHVHSGADYEDIMEGITLFVAAMIKSNTKAKDAVKDFIVFSYNLHATFYGMCQLNLGNSTNQEN